MEICGLAPSRVVGPSGVGHAGRLLGVRDRARPPDRLGHRLHRHLAARPGPGDRLRADRRRPLGVDRRTGRGHARRHRDRPVRHGHLRLALAGRGRRGDRARGRQGRRTRRKRIVAHMLEAAPEDIEVRDGKFSVKGSPDKGMALAEVARAAYIPVEPAGGHGARARGDDVLRPGELRVAVRRPRVRRRRGRRDRQGEGRPLRRASTTAARRSTR